MRKKLDTASLILNILSVITTGFIAWLGFTVYREIDISEGTRNKLQTLLDNATKTVEASQENIEWSRPHYNLVVGFFDGNAKADPQIKDRIEIEKNVPTGLDIRVWNISTGRKNVDTATRRADDVSCIVEFPRDFSVTADPSAAKNHHVYAQRVPQYGGGVIAGIDYGENYALHPGTDFFFYVPIVAHKSGEFALKVTADANNPISPKPAFQKELWVNVK